PLATTPASDPLIYCLHPMPMPPQSLPPSVTADTSLLPLPPPLLSLPLPAAIVIAPASHCRHQCYSLLRC
ncbi:hypothetical protein BHM03_00052986, partial [Ensete ventricosum]